MATLAHPATANQVSFGQLGSVYTKSGSDAVLPPTGKVFVAITVLEDTTFDSSGGLISEVPTKYFGSEGIGEGSGGIQLTNAVVFPKGMTLFGRWTQIDVNVGSCIAYISD
tara:strand:+ start:6420 stop:6752 length:333 start_codon:yes stop_codon:yes gene_type:complete